VGELSFSTGKPQFVQKVIDQAEGKLAAVRSGQVTFGAPMVLQDFEEVFPPYSLMATVINLFFMNVLFSGNVMETKDGKVSVFPVTVFKSDTLKNTGQTGFPCLAIHISHFKTLIWRIYSVTRRLINSDNLWQNLSAYSCRYNSLRDEPLITLSGMDPYNATQKKKLPSFLLLPAHWVDVMKHFFIHRGSTLRDIGDIFRQVYRNIPALQGKFDNVFRCIWLGEVRSANVMNMIKHPSADHVFSMTRLRAVNGQVNIGRNGMRWVLQDITLPATYNEESFAYGLETWNQQLAMLNTAYAFFTGEKMSATKPFHQHGLLVADHTLSVCTRQESLDKGIFNDTERHIIDKQIRSDRHRLKNLSPAFVVNFFGECVNVYNKRK
jgi:hypothetical protein